MTFFTIDNPVAPSQRKIGFFVIEITKGFHFVKRKFAVTFPAIGTEFILVYINVATGAVGKSNPCENLEFLPVSLFCFMTFFTTYSLVFSNKCKFRF